MRKIQSGFTLIELLVVAGVFSVVVIVIVSIFVSLIRLERNLLQTKKALSEANYAMEVMTRSLRMAQKDYDGSCLGMAGLNYLALDLGQRIRFKNGNENGECQEFYLENQQIKFKRENQVPVSLTSPGIKVSNLKFYLQGESQEDDRQPLVTIMFVIEIPGTKPLNFQTSISQRSLDYSY